MKVLDSDLIIDFLDKEAKAVEKMRTLLAANEHLVTTVLNAQEVLVGALRDKSEIKYKASLEFFQEIPILDYEWEAVPITSKLQEYLSRQGTPIGAFDTIIAGICLANNATIITGNARHFSLVPGLSVEEL